MKFLQTFVANIRKKASQNGYVCDGCGVEIFEYPFRRLCEECEGKMRRNDGLRCGKCGRQTLAKGVCLVCKSKMPRFDVGVSPFVYYGQTAAFVNRIKNGKRRLAYYFAEQMTEALLRCKRIQRATEARESLLIVPVPMTETARQNRGYNQAEDLAEIVAQGVAKTLEEQNVCVEYDADVLQKRKETAQQKHLTYFERAKNIEGAYHVHKRALCKGKIVVLVDDIMTTGATASECAKKLIGAGAQEVMLLVAAALPERK